MIFDDIVDYCVDGTETMQLDAIIIRKTTKVWEILIQWKDGSTTWESIKYVKEC